MSKLKRKQRVDKLIYKAKNCEFFAHGPKKRKPLMSVVLKMNIILIATEGNILSEILIFCQIIDFTLIVSTVLKVAKSQ